MIEQQFDTPADALLHFGIKGMRWGVRKAPERSGKAYGKPYSPTNGMGHGSKYAELKKPERLVVDSSRGFDDIRPAKGFEGPAVEAHHAELVEGITELRKEYPNLQKLKIEVVPMSAVPGMQMMIWDKVPAAALHMKDGEVRLMYNDKHKKMSKRNLKIQAKLQPDVATKGFLGRHEMGHVLAMGGGIMPGSWDAAHGNYNDHVVYEAKVNKAHRDVLVKHGLSFKEVSKLSPYAATHPVEALAELSGNYFTPSLNQKMTPEMRQKSKSLFDDLGGKS